VILHVKGFKEREDTDFTSCPKTFIYK